MWNERRDSCLGKEKGAEGIPDRASRVPNARPSSFTAGASTQTGTTRRAESAFAVCATGIGAGRAASSYCRVDEAAAHRRRWPVVGLTVGPMGHRVISPLLVGSCCREPLRFEVLGEIRSAFWVALVWSDAARPSLGRRPRELTESKKRQAQIPGSGTFDELRGRIVSPTQSSRSRTSLAPSSVRPPSFAACVGDREETTEGGALRCTGRRRETRRARRHPWRGGWGGAGLRV